METQSGKTTTKHSQVPGTHGLVVACAVQAERQQVSLDVMISLIYI